MSLQKHKHAELIKAWADGAKIQVFNGEWDDCHEQEYLTWDKNFKYRVNPKCNYAVNEVVRLGGDEAFDIYSHWLEGGFVEYMDSQFNPGLEFEDLVLDDCPDPLRAFTAYIESAEVLRKKKTKIKQALWVSDEHSSKISKRGNKLSCEWFDDGYNPNDVICGLPDIKWKWHRVPTCTREIEVD